MLKSINKTNAYKSLEMGKKTFHAYLFYSLDKVLNDNFALTYAKSLICENHSACNSCNACKQFDSSSHPDVIVLNSDNYKVEDVENLSAKLSSKPISSDKKVFVILNFDNMNETAQNKLLKSLEEPNPATVFILTTTKTDKLLPTILSRLNKIYLPKLSLEDKKLISNELNLDSEIQNRFLSSSYNLTDLYMTLNDENYSLTLNAIITAFKNLNTSQDIPKVSTSLLKVDKDKFFNLILDIFMCALKDDKSKYGGEIVDILNLKFNKKVLTQTLTHINEAYTRHKANVNFGYILDTLLFSILKEKFLCK